MKKWGQTLFFALVIAWDGAAAAADCRVLDPELQGAYAGPCVNGLAEGAGQAKGVAEYQGGFKEGRKHGKGVKTWPNGDRYEGEFFEDRKEGVGVYTWGRGPWQCERYEGGYRDDRRHGFGIYRYATGDFYSGPWENDIPTGPPTPMMQRQAQFQKEARAALAAEGQKVCRSMPVGIALQEWIRGTVVGVTPEKVAIRMDEIGTHRHVVANVEIRKGDIVWDSPEAWTPCY